MTRGGHLQIKTYTRKARNEPDSFARSQGTFHWLLLLLLLSLSLIFFLPGHCRTRTPDSYARPCDDRSLASAPGLSGRGKKPGSCFLDR